MRDVVDKKPFSSIGFVFPPPPHIFGRWPSALGPVFLENIAKPFEIRNLASEVFIGQAGLRRSLGVASETLV